MKKTIYLITIVIILILLTACMNQSNNEQDPVQKKEKAPETLTTVSEGIDELLNSVDSIAETMDLTESEFQAERSQQQDEEDQSDDGNEEDDQEQDQQEESQNSEEQEKQGQEQSQQQETLTRDDELFLSWKQVDEKLKEIHKSWNSYEVESIEKGANHQKSNELKENLNDFTVAVDNRQMEDILDAGSRTINSLAVFFELYKDEIRGDLFRIKYSIYQTFLQASNNNMEDANNLIDETEEYTSRIRQKLEEDDDKVKDLEKLTLAISDMKLALEDGNIGLLEIKRDIALENIKSLQE